MLITRKPREAEETDPPSYVPPGLVGYFRELKGKTDRPELTCSIDLVEMLKRLIFAPEMQSVWELRSWDGEWLWNAVRRAKYKGDIREEKRYTAKGWKESNTTVAELASALSKFIEKNFQEDFDPWQWELAELANLAAERAENPPPSDVKQPKRKRYRVNAFARSLANDIRKLRNEDSNVDKRVNFVIATITNVALGLDDPGSDTSQLIAADVHEILRDRSSGNSRTKSKKNSHDTGE